MYSETGERSACPFRYPGQYENEETHTYTYDARNRLVRTGQVHYTYDAEYVPR
ncbi:hypothetical protein [Brevibacillus laterosporus]|uniref:hypothetical protein n=1 Tax=Brevibacillus laterosporus TaxID=1465 RepID=UPI0015E1CAF3|nr:hypothetical protein [Brevibacillus laterosporus]MED1665252.1 hypothetical protein [Brevibacillus laterosporus]MED1668618.1 hypothetical protein [Brevibacillus laterosporus]MED1719219.1 hypothetical protein [Brevibacillus laterosporus]